MDNESITLRNELRSLLADLTIEELRVAENVISEVKLRRSCAESTPAEALSERLSRKPRNQLTPQALGLKS